jgi:DNA mismatch endonuclease, patch repair protein
MPGKDEMVDVVDRKTRSRMMAGIRGKDTKPELALRKALHHLGLRYRLHVPDLPGRPDIVLPRHRAAIQVHGCFWHRHEHCAFSTTPTSNIGFWDLKFGETIKRDKRNLEGLLGCGWRVAIVWECSINPRGVEVVVKEIADWLPTRSSFTEIPRAMAGKAAPRLKARKKI